VWLCTIIAYKLTKKSWPRQQQALFCEKVAGTWLCGHEPQAGTPLAAIARAAVSAFFFNDD
jgi:hypothetical protein